MKNHCSFILLQAMYQQRHMVYLLLLHFNTPTSHFLLIVCLCSNTRQTGQAPFLFQSQYAGICVIILPPSLLLARMFTMFIQTLAHWKDEKTDSANASYSPAPEPENPSSSSPEESRSSGGRFRFVVCFKEKGKRCW